MKKSIKVETSTTTPTDNNFYNLFFPIIPYLSKIGIAAQVISALTEAITIYLIVQSSLSNQNKILAFIASIVAVALIVYLLEVGTRRFLQVLTRVIIWKQLKNFWYASLFALVVLVSSGALFFSIKLSTRGINYALTNSSSTKQVYDTTPDKKELREEIKAIAGKFDQERQTIERAFLESKTATATLFDARINEQESKVSAFEQKDKAGERWASSHAAKWKSKVSATRTARSNELATITANYTRTLKDWQNRSNEATQAATDQNTAAIQAATATHENNEETTRATANFWGNLFSSLVGSCIVLAFVCIISVEFFRRGSGMKMQYTQIEKEPSLLSLFFAGIETRLSNLFRKPLQRFAQIAIHHPTAPRKIGFSASLARSTKSKISTKSEERNISKVNNLKVENPTYYATMEAGTILPNNEGTTGNAHTGNDDRMERYDTGGTIGQQDAPQTPGTTIKTVFVEVDKLSTCEHCQNEYKRNSKKQRFCSTSCRKSAWTKKNGREPYLKKGK